MRKWTRRTTGRLAVVLIAASMSMTAVSRADTADSLPASRTGRTYQNERWKHRQGQAGQTGASEGRPDATKDTPPADFSDQSEAMEWLPGETESETDGKAEESTETEIREESEGISEATVVLLPTMSAAQAETVEGLSGEMESETDGKAEDSTETENWEESEELSEGPAVLPQALSEVQAETPEGMSGETEAERDNIDEDSTDSTETEFREESEPLTETQDQTETSMQAETPATDFPGEPIHGKTDEGWTLPAILCAALAAVIFLLAILIFRMKAKQRKKAALKKRGEEMEKRQQPDDTADSSVTTVPLMAQDQDRTIMMYDLLNEPVRLTLINEAHESEQYEVDLVNSLRIGRSKACDITIDNDRNMSGVHCRLFKADQGICIEDCGSLNGTYLNDTLVTEATALRDGDVINMGMTRLIVKFGK